MFRSILLTLTLTGSITNFVYAQKKMCITVDDLPTVSQPDQAPGAQDSLTKRLIAHFTRHQVPAIGFVIGQKLVSQNRMNRKQVSLLRQWLQAGLMLGNHTYAHKGYNTVSAADYLQDVRQGDSLLRSLPVQPSQHPRYFRHPYLQRGNTIAKRDSLVQYLRTHRYQEAPVSIDNSDYLFSAAYEVAVARKDSGLAATIGKTYVEYMLAYVHYYEAQADSLFKRPIAHILLTHANSINSFYLGNLLSRLALEGYQFIALQEALQDSAYRSQDTYVQNGGISWIHRWALTQGKRGSFYKGEPEVPPLIMGLLDSK